MLIVISEPSSEVLPVMQQLAFTNGSNSSKGCVM